MGWRLESLVVGIIDGDMELDCGGFMKPRNQVHRNYGSGRVGGKAYNGHSLLNIFNFPPLHPH